MIAVLPFQIEFVSIIVRFKLVGSTKSLYAVLF